MPEHTHVRCHLCGAERPIPETAIAASPTLSHRVDAAISAAWFCPEPCFSKFRHSPNLRKRVYHEQDRIAEEVKATLRQTTPAQLRGMQDLPAGLRVSERDGARLATLLEQLDDVSQLQDEPDLWLLLTVYRNLAQQPYFHDQARTLVDYDTLRENLARLEGGV